MYRVLAIIILCFFGSSHSLACSCNYIGPINYYDNADYIILGTVVNSNDSCELLDIPKGGFCRAGPIVSLVSVEKTFKKQGFSCNENRETEEFIVQQGSMCDIPLKVGHRYLLFIKAKPTGVKIVPSCSGSFTVNEDNRAQLEQVARLSDLRAELQSEYNREIRKTRCKE